MSAVDRLDEQHTLIAPAVRYVIEQNDILPDPAFDALAGVTRRWETALRAVLALAEDHDSGRRVQVRLIPALAIVTVITAALDGAP